MRLDTGKYRRYTKQPYTTTLPTVSINIVTLLGRYRRCNTGLKRLNAYNPDQHRKAAIDKVKITLNVVSEAENLSQIITHLVRFEELHLALPTSKKSAKQMTTETLETKVRAACDLRSEILTLCQKEKSRYAF